MRINTIAFVGIPVTDIERARDFYEGVLGLKTAEEMMGGKWIEYAVGGHTIAIANVGDQWKPSHEGTSAAFEVEDFDQTIQTLRNKGIRFAAEPFETPDPDGNKLIIHKLKPEKEEEV
jgi:predicted enzyme related to lactoylglutathione lyase